MTLTLMTARSCVRSYFTSDYGTTVHGSGERSHVCTLLTLEIESFASNVAA